MLTREQLAQMRAGVPSAGMVNMTPTERDNLLSALDLADAAFVLANDLRNASSLLVVYRMQRHPGEALLDRASASQAAVENHPTASRLIADADGRNEDRT